MGIDDESLRTLESVGLADEATRDMIPNTPIRYYSSDGHCFAHVKPTERPFGWPRRNNFLQPLFERTLRDGLPRFASVEIRYGWEFRGFKQDDEGVTVEILDPLRHSSHDQDSVSRWRRRRPSTVRLLGRVATPWIDGGLEMAGRRRQKRPMVAPYAAVHCHPEQSDHGDRAPVPAIVASSSNSRPPTSKKRW